MYVPTLPIAVDESFDRKAVDRGRCAVDGSDAQLVIADGMAEACEKTLNTLADSSGDSRTPNGW
jgi:hypothetical protein